jgi:hypothetical protein
MSGQHDIRAEVDRLLAARKTLLGTGEWLPPNSGDGEHRFVRRLAVAGSDCDMTLTIKSRPPYTNDCFRFILEYGYAVFRVDYVSWEIHNNQPGGPPDIDIGLVEGPHYHAWADNKRLCTRISLAKEMKYARLLPRNVRGFENAFRWFCGETNIELGPGDIPDLPGRTLLV